jgi:hypothetical protein
MSSPSNPSRRDVLIGAATTAAAAPPAVSKPKAFAPISSIYPEGSWPEADDHEAQSFAQAMNQVAAG